MRSSTLANRIRISATALVLSIVLGSASNASTVTITGGFTSFSGVVGGTDNGITSTLNGQPLCADSGCTNTDVANVTFGSPQSNVTFQNASPSPNTENAVQFLAAGPQNVLGTGPTNIFLIGQLGFTNGIWTGDASFGFTLTTHSSNALFDGQSFSDTIVMRLTSPNTGTPAQNADFIYFAGVPGLGSLRAYELFDSPTGSNTVTVNLFGYIDSLHLSGFTDPQGGGFINSSTDLALAATPLPATLPLFASGVGALGLLGCRQKKKAAVLAT